MAEVFLAWQRSVAGFARPVVLKHILDGMKTHADSLHMFVQEAKITACFSHGNIAQLYDLLFEDGELYMVMEFIPGATLVEIARATLAAGTEIPVGFSSAICRHAALALHYAHSYVDPAGLPKPTIHRDVAGKNIMVGFDGSTKLLDFGIAKQAGAESSTRQGTVRGTGGYMSPEQARGEVLDARSDVFSLAIVLHEMLTGRWLFARATVAEEMQVLLRGSVIPPSKLNPLVPVALDAVVLKALSLRREDRYESAKAFARAVEQAVGKDLWTEEQASLLCRKHFGARQAQLREVLSERSASGTGNFADADEPTTSADVGAQSGVNAIPTVASVTPIRAGNPTTAERRVVTAATTPESPNLRVTPIEEHVTQLAGDVPRWPVGWMITVALGAAALGAIGTLLVHR